MKRIISLILVVVMSVLALASCGYSIADENIADYATFTNKDEFLNLIKTGLQIVDGDFTSDEKTRDEKVLDNLYKQLAETAKKGEQLKAGTVKANDVLGYCYYCTFTEEDGTVRYFYTDKMKSASALSVQLGLFEADEIAKGIAGVITGVEGKIETVYESFTTGTTKAGDVAFVEYTYSYTDAEGGIHTENPKVEYQMIVIGDSFTETEKEDGTKEKTPNDFATYLQGKTVGATNAIPKIEFEEERGKVVYDSIKINWIGNTNKALGTFEHTPFDKTTKVKDAMGVEKDLKDVKLTYNIFPVYFYNVPELDAKSIVNDILGKNITEATLISILFGEDYEGLHVDHEGHDHDEDDFTDEEKANMEQLEKWLEEVYIFEDGDKKLTLSELADLISDLQGNVADDKTALDSAKKKYDEAKDAVDAAGENATEDQKSNLTKAEKAYNDAKKEYDDAVAKRDEKVNLLLNKETDDKDEAGNPIKVSTKIYEGQLDRKYRELRTAYNKEVKKALFNEVFYFIKKYAVINEGAELPTEAVEKAYDQLIQNYESTFYSNTTTNKDYKDNGGDFKKYLPGAVKTDYKKLIGSDITIENYDQALDALEVMAKEYVRPIVQIYCAADALGLRVTEEEYASYVDEKGEDFMEYYGADAEYAQQFDKLMDYFLESEEEDGEVTYKLITFKRVSKDEKSSSELDKIEDK